MLFNSFSFIVFFVFVLFIYFWLPNKNKKVFLLIISYLFYACWNVKYVLLLLIVTFITYYSAKQIVKYISYRKTILLICISFNVLLLFLFKYINFSISILNSFIIKLGGETTFTVWDIILPVGISFYIFQALSYVIDVYKNKVSVETNIIYYFLFVSFFPQLLSGPIGRADQLMPQFQRQNYRFKFDNARDGLQLIIWGVFKKIVIANRLAIYVDKVFDNLDRFGTYEIILASFFFTIQIYCDFSGYTDMAVGVAKMMGYDLIRNFKRPYIADSVSDFWKKWHISLSTWLRDYIYIPLGGNRVSRFRHKINILITFLISGIWHGANWTFVLWGGLHGLAQIFESIFPFRSEKKMLILIHRFIIFLFVSFAWIFFRANSVRDICDILKKMTIAVTPLNMDNWEKFVTGIDFVTFNNVVTHNVINALTILGVIVLFCSQFIIKDDCIDHYLNKRPRFYRLSINTIIILLILFCGVFDNTQFIYFQF